VHNNVWTLAPHAHDRQLDDINQLATAAQELMANPASRPQSIRRPAERRIMPLKPT
jgi:hypothetical protein